MNVMMNGPEKYSDGAVTANATPLAVGEDEDDEENAARGLLEPTLVPAATERVDVVAPASLPGGYELPCDFRGRSVVVRAVRT
jgi:hypothetical protein